MTLLLLRRMCAVVCVCAVREQVWRSNVVYLRVPCVSSRASVICGQCGYAGDGRQTSGQPIVSTGRTDMGRKWNVVGRKWWKRWQISMCRWVTPSPC